ncbi:MAG: LPS translocon maturation chaperone LptM [Parvibaculales bacterium]
MTQIHKDIRVTVALVLLLGLCLSLSACGRRGDLYLPEMSNLSGFEERQAHASL